LKIGEKGIERARKEMVGCKEEEEKEKTKRKRAQNERRNNDV
jgi:hypothetical protein